MPSHHHPRKKERGINKLAEAGHIQMSVHVGQKETTVVALPEYFSNEPAVSNINTEIANSDTL